MFDSSVLEPGALAGLSDAELVDAAQTTSRAENIACARKMAVMAELFSRRVDLAPEDRLNWWVDPEAAVSAEIAAAHHITGGLALHQTYRAVVLRDRLPRVGALFLQGLINELLVRAIITRTDLITDPDVIAAVDAELAADILRWGPLSAKKTDAAIDAIVARHDPDAVRQSRQHDVGRAIEFGSPGDAPGFTTVWARMFNGDAAVGERTLTAMAYSVCDDDPRSVDERRNDALTALFHGITSLACRCGRPDCEAAANPKPLRELTVYALTDRTTAVDGLCEGEAATSVNEETDGVAAADDDPTGEHTETPPTPATAPAKPRRAKPTLIPGRSGYLFGSGFMPAPLFDALLDDAKVRELIHPGQSGPEPRYTPSAALAAFVRCRDLTCRFPGCDTPATEADIDHTVPHPLGPTHASNLKSLCRFHHLLKTFWAGRGGWQDRQHPDGTVIWTSPTGHTYTTHPGSRLLFPTLCTPTATLWTGDPPDNPVGGHRTAKMPRRQRTRARSRAAYITAERKRNAEERPDGPRGSDPPF